LHPSPEHGIKTITGAKARHGIKPAKAMDSAAPPSLLSIRIHAEKESPPRFSTDWPLNGELNRFAVFQYS
jgi:hypothetical protein